MGWIYPSNFIGWWNLYWPQWSWPARYWAWLYWPVEAMRNPFCKIETVRWRTHVAGREPRA